MKKLLKNSLFSIWLPVALFFGFFAYFLFSFTSQFIEPLPEKKITIATGREDGNYHALALEYKKLLAKEKVELHIIPTAGSLDALKLVQNNQADIAFYQSGLLKEHNHSEVESLATIYFEPISIFYNKELNLSYINQLKGKRIAIGEEGSGTKVVASKLLRANLIDQNNSTLHYLNNQQALEAIQNRHIDALFIVSSANSAVITALLQSPDIELLHIKRAQAYDKRFAYLTALTLYEGSIDLMENLPNKDTTLLSTTASLIANQSLEDELIRIFMKQLKKVHIKESILQKRGEFPSQNYLEIELNSEAKRYLEHGDTWLEKIFPFWIANNIDRLKILLIPLITLLIPLLKSALPIYRWSIRFSIYRWYDDINAIDLKLDTPLSKEELESLYQELMHLSKEIKETTKVPLSYMGEYYNLRIHLRLITQRIQEYIHRSNP
jgi:TRAP transporter TAXI family solute receptor